MYSWQQLKENTAILFGGGTEGRRKATEFFNSNKYIIGGTVLGVALLYSIRRLYIRSRSKPAVTPASSNLASPCSPKKSHLGNSVSSNCDKAQNLENQYLSNCSPEVIEDTSNILKEMNETGDNKETASNADTSSTHSSPKHTSDSEGPPVVNGEEGSVAAAAKKKKDKKLNEKLLKYYNNYVYINQNHLNIVTGIVEDIKQMFVRCCEELLPHHGISGLRTGDSISLQAVKPDEVEVYVDLALDPALWLLVDAGQSIMAAHGYWLVKRQQLQFFSHGTNRYDKYLTADYLSPHKILYVFLDMINRVAKWSDEYKVQAEVVGPSVTLTVFYEDNLGIQQAVDIDFIPSVSLQDVVVIAKTHPAANDDLSFANLWRQSFEEQEHRLLFAQQPEQSVAPRCLQILKAMRRSFPYQFGLLSSYYFKCVLLQVLSREQDWCEDDLADRFVDLLRAIETSFRTQTQGHYLCPGINLLQHFNASLLEYVGQSIAEVLQAENYDGLLQVPQ